MARDRIPEPRDVTTLLDELHEIKERMPIDKFVELVKAGTETQNRDAVLLMRAGRALKDHVHAELGKSAVIEKLNRDIPRLKRLLSFSLDEDHAREFLYAIHNGRNVRDADDLCIPERWGGPPITQIFGSNMWQSFLARNPEHRQEIVRQLRGEFPDDHDFIEESMSSPSHGKMYTAQTAHQFKIWERFLELTFLQLKEALEDTEADNPSEP